MADTYEDRVRIHIELAEKIQKDIEEKSHFDREMDPRNDRDAHIAIASVYAKLAAIPADQIPRTVTPYSEP